MADDNATWTARMVRELQVYQEFAERIDALFVEIQACNARILQLLDEHGGDE